MIFGKSNTARKARIKQAQSVLAGFGNYKARRKRSPRKMETHEVVAKLKARMRNSDGQ